MEKKHLMAMASERARAWQYQPAFLFSSSSLLSSLELSDTKVYAPSKRALLGTASHPPPAFCHALDLYWRSLESGTQVKAVGKDGLMGGGWQGIVRVRGGINPPFFQARDLCWRSLESGTMEKDGLMAGVRGQQES